MALRSSRSRINYNRSLKGTFFGDGDQHDALFEGDDVVDTTGLKVLT
jgi:hypothetical protein